MSVGTRTSVLSAANHARPTSTRTLSDTERLAGITSRPATMSSSTSGTATHRKNLRSGAALGRASGWCVGGQAPQRKCGCTEEVCYCEVSQRTLQTRVSWQ